MVYVSLLTVMPDWASDVKSRKSVSGMVIKLNESDSRVFWRTAKQRSVSLSTCESENMALSGLAQEVSFLKHAFESFNYKTTLPTLFSDNQGAICVAHETASRSRTKQTGEMTLKYLPTTVMVASVLTKGLPRVHLVQICKLLFGNAFCGGVLKHASVISQCSDMVA